MLGSTRLLALWAAIKADAIEVDHWAVAEFEKLIGHDDEIEPAEEGSVDTGASTSASSGSGAAAPPASTGTAGAAPAADPTSVTIYGRAYPVSTGAKAWVPGMADLVWTTRSNDGTKPERALTTSELGTLVVAPAIGPEVGSLMGLWCTLDDGTTASCYNGGATDQIIASWNEGAWALHNAPAATQGQ